MKVKKILFSICLVILVLILTSCKPAYGRNPNGGGIYRVYYYFDSTDEHLKVIRKHDVDTTDIGKSFYMIHLDNEVEMIEDMNSIVKEMYKNKYTEIEDTSPFIMYFKPKNNQYNMTSIEIYHANLELGDVKEDLSFEREEPDERYEHSIATEDDKYLELYVDYSSQTKNGNVFEQKYKSTHLKYRPNSDFLIDLLKAKETYWHLVSQWKIYHTNELGEKKYIGTVRFVYNLGVDYISDYQGEYFSNEGHSKMTQWVSDEVIEYENIWIDLIYKNLEIYDY